MGEALEIRAQLSAQRALWGQVTPALRAVSVDIDESKVYFRCVFDGEPTEYDWDLMSCAAAEIISDFPEPYDIQEEYLAVAFSAEINHLRFAIYWRHEIRYDE